MWTAAEDLQGKRAASQERRYTRGGLRAGGQHGVRLNETVEGRLLGVLDNF